MVKFAIKHDKGGVLRFASLQSDIGKAIKNQFKIDDAVDSLVFVQSSIVQ